MNFYEVMKSMECQENTKSMIFMTSIEFNYESPAENFTVMKRKSKFFGHKIRRNRVTKILLQAQCIGISFFRRPMKKGTYDIKE